MLGAAVIVFRETLEAALLIGIVAAASRSIVGRNRWIGIGITAGVSGALVVAALTKRIALLANGAGQELFNAAVLGVAVVMLGWHNIWMARHGKEMAMHARSVVQSVRDGGRELSAIALVIALAVLREGSETALFLYGLFAGGSLSVTGAISGGALGLVAGGLVGFALYAGLVRIPVRLLFSVTGALILLLAAGMAGQMARFLIQGDFIPDVMTPLWDTSSVLPIDSPVGSLLHVLVGYDSRPSAMQMLFYVVALVLILSGMRWARLRMQHSAAS